MQFSALLGKKDNNEEPSLLNERNNASTSRSMCLNLEDKVDFNGGGIVMCDYC